MAMRSIMRRSRRQRAVARRIIRSSRRWRFTGSFARKVFACGIGFVSLAGTSVARADESAAILAAKADWSCVNFSVIGACRRNTPPFAGAKVRYWQPVLMVETVKRPGQSGIMEYRSLVGSLAGNVADKNDGAGASGQADTTGLQMNEVHVFGFPFADAFSLAVETPCEGMPDIGGTVSYLSEQDTSEWRTACSEKDGPLARMTTKSGPLCDRFGPLLPGLCVGTWGALYPRTGFVTHASEVVGSAMAAFRAVDVAALKLFTAHRVISPVLFWPSVRYDRMQLVSPVGGRCIPIGENPASWENGTRSRDGRYVWVYWRKKECCLF